jgi:glycosyltransferase involved in cell wall biosynthesis
MHVLIDATAMPANRAGAGVYTYQLTRALAHAVPAGDRLTVVDRWAAFSDLSALPSVTVQPARLGSRARRALWEQSALPLLLRRIGADVFHSPHHSMPVVSGWVRTVVTVHDVTFRLMPWRYTRMRRWYMSLVTALTARCADAIIVPSRSVASDLTRLFGVPAARINVVPEAAPPSMRVIGDPDLLSAARRRLALPERFILSLGTLEPGENRANLLRAFARLRARGLPHALVVTGQRGWRDDGGAMLAARLGVTASVHFTGYVSDADLPLLYNLADAFVFPSWREGFGLPPLEAMACGVPVVASDRPAMPEVLGDAALYAAPDQPQAIADALERALTDRALRDELRTRGSAQAARYSWQRAADETLAVYRRLLHPGPG